MRKLSYFVIFTLLIASCAGLLPGATYGILAVVAAQGTLTGIARDKAGAVIPLAEVTTVNASTNANFTATTDDQGIYTLRTLPAGTYNVSVEATGFKKFVFTDAVVRVNEEVRLDMTLGAGAVAEVVTVMAETTAVDTVSSTLKTVIDERRIIDLPLDGRNPNSLVLLVAGVQSDTRTSKLKEQLATA